MLVRHQVLPGSSHLLGPDRREQSLPPRVAPPPQLPTAEDESGRYADGCDGSRGQRPDSFEIHESHDLRPERLRGSAFYSSVKTADINGPAAHCELVYEIPIKQ